MRASEPLRNVKTKSGGKQLLKRRPLLRGRRRLAKPAHSAIDPPGAEFLMGEIHIVRAEFSSAAGADVVIPRRKWQSSIAANWTDMHVQNLIRHETLKYSKFVDRLWVTPGTGQSMFALHHSRSTHQTHRSPARSAPDPPDFEYNPAPSNSLGQAGMRQP